MQPLISVIIPVYNGEKFVERCIKMLEAQTYYNFEVIFVDDGSSDDTKLLLEKYSKTDKRICFISKNNQGVSAARNDGIEKSKGEYILFVDADDYIYPEHLMMLYNNLVKYDADISVGNYYKLSIDEKSPVLHNRGVVDVYTGDEAAKAMLYRKKLNGYPVVKMLKRDLLKNIRFEKGVAYGEDAIFVKQVYLEARRVVYSSDITYLYYQNPASANHSVNYDSIRSSWNAAQKAFGYNEVNTKHDLVKAGTAKLFILASDFSCRLMNAKGYSNLKEELARYISENASAIRKDKDCKKFNRFLAGIASINPWLMLGICKAYLDLSCLLHIERRKSL